MGYDYREITKAAAEALPRKTRQRFLDLMWSGKKLGDAQKMCDISFDAALGIMNMNISERKYLRRETR